MDTENYRPEATPLRPHPETTTGQLSEVLDNRNRIVRGGDLDSIGDSNSFQGKWRLFVRGVVGRLRNVNETLAAFRNGFAEEARDDYVDAVAALSDYIDGDGNHFVKTRVERTGPDGETIPQDDTFTIEVVRSMGYVTDVRLVGDVNGSDDAANHSSSYNSVHP